MKIRLLATSDVHGMIVPYHYSDRLDAKHGLCRLHTLINQYRDENTLLLDNGDVLQGSPLDYFHHVKRESKIHPMAKAFKALNYDYLNLGNHDFNFGQEVLRRYLRDAGIPCITGNIKSEEPYGVDYVVHRFDDKHAIAIIGAVTQHIPIWEQPHNITGLTFINALDYVQKTVEVIQAKEKVQGIVLLYHGGFERDLESGEPTEVLNGENLGYAICSQVKGLDVVISGHQHRSLAGFCFQKAVTQTRSNGEELAVVDWDLDKHEINPRVILAPQAFQPLLLDIIQEEEEACQKWLDQPLGALEAGDLLIGDPWQARVHKHPLISFLNQVQLDCSKAQLSAIALFNGARGFAHEITMRDLVSTYIYPNTLVVHKINGAKLRQFLEKCAEYFALRDGQLCVNPRYLAPKPQHYNYDMVDGVDYTIDVRKPQGERIVSLLYEGQPVLDEQEFTIALSNYRSGGGGDFDFVRDWEIVSSSPREMVEILADYIRQHPILVIHHRENITVLPK
ncbi:MAG: bifunctional metallophosphatase/5'-nucleotidase [Erysipelotrichaceae bacterium]|jgi:2',3'-cyclic-nucleotide 2'-phosphodiesterase/3'-nucleotidase|nr:bifunctional metallophosphatase/5'-nucleotidase [Erysipelotrichaceae bacterium]